MASAVFRFVNLAVLQRADALRKRVGDVLQAQVTGVSFACSDDLNGPRARPADAVSPGDCCTAAVWLWHACNAGQLVASFPRHDKCLRHPQFVAGHNKHALPPGEIPG